MCVTTCNSKCPLKVTGTSFELTCEMSVCLFCTQRYTVDGEHIPLALGCGHSYAKSCLKVYFTKYCAGKPMTCPNCRYIIGVPFDQLKPNYTAIDMLHSEVQRQASVEYESPYLRGAAVIIDEKLRDILQKIQDIESKEKSDKNVYQQAVTLKMISSEEKVKDLEKELMQERTKLAEYGLALNNCPHKCTNLLNGLNLVHELIKSEAYLAETQNLCMNIMKSRKLAFMDIELSYDLATLRRRRKEVQAMVEWLGNDAKRKYYISLLELEYHYLFPSIQDKFNIWNLLSNRAELRGLMDAEYDSGRDVCESLCKLHPNVPMQL